MYTVNRNPVCVYSIDTYNNIKIWYLRSMFNLKSDVGIAVIPYYTIYKYYRIFTKRAR